MRIFFILLIIPLTTIQTVSQSIEHLSFKGVPIDGSLSEYVAKMKQNGFELLGTEDNTAILYGDFAGYKDCHVGVSTLKQKDLVYKIGVIFPERDTWSTLSGNYFDLKEMLKEKYGNPKEEVENFDVESFQLPLNDNDKMHEIIMDNCKYYSVWQTDKGEIQLAIDHSDVTSCFVKLAYFDKINGDKIKAKAMGDL